MRNFLYLFALCAAIVAVPALSGTSTPEDKIDARRGYCRLIGHNTDLIVEMAKGEKDYDARRAADLAGNLRVLSAMKLGALWPEGSDSESMPGKTATLPAAFEDFEDYRHKGDAFAKAAADLAENADTGLFTMRLMTDRLEETCASCHGAYRAGDPEQ